MTSGSLAGKERSQEELYLLYNLLLESGRQMAFTAVAAPSQLPGLEPRLATRLGGGLVLELGPPDREARVSEVERLLGGKVDPDLVDYLGARAVGSLRELQQLVQRLSSAAEERETPLSMEVARAILEGNPGRCRVRRAAATACSLPGAVRFVRARR